MRRAGLDYHEYATVEVHDDWPSCASHFREKRLFAVSTKGAQRYDLNRYGAGDAFLFGPETRGLPAELLAQFSGFHFHRPGFRRFARLWLGNAVDMAV